MGKKNKSKKNKHKNKVKSPSPNGEDNMNIDESEKQNDSSENKSPKKKLSKEMLHKKKEMRRKIKKIRKKSKKKSSKENLDLEYQYLEEFEDLFMNPEDLEKMPHDKFITYAIPTTIDENKEYIPILISDSDIILELLDARDIYHSKNGKIEELVNNNEKKQLIYVITKSDLVSEEYINKIKNDLEQKNNNKIPIIVTSSLMREKIKHFFDELQTHI
jgi:ethanolamine utilization protein EutP (predicted NTPase)